MREEPERQKETHCTTRITPACAGRTFFPLYQQHLIQDHPRVCGKNYALWRVMKSPGGSPPRVREELLRHKTLTKYRGITPACAGRTFIQSLGIRVPKDHPRVCGKNTTLNGNEDNIQGSPPRVREELNLLKVPGLTDRITPACAGRTLFSFLLQPFF